MYKIVSLSDHQFVRSNRKLGIQAASGSKYSTNWQITFTKQPERNFSTSTKPASTPLKINSKEIIFITADKSFITSLDLIDGNHKQSYKLDKLGLKIEISTSFESLKDETQLIAYLRQEFPKISKQAFHLFITDLNLSLKKDIDQDDFLQLLWDKLIKHFVNSKLLEKREIKTLNKLLLNRNFALFEFLWPETNAKILVFQNMSQIHNLTDTLNLWNNLIDAKKHYYKADRQFNVPRLAEKLDELLKLSLFHDPVYIHIPDDNSAKTLAEKGVYSTK